MFSSASIKDNVVTPPTIQGGRARAWLVDLAAARAHFPGQEDACVCHWVVEAPWAHLAWHSYSILVVHLRPMNDARPTKFYLEGATHEIMVMALNPDCDRNDILRDARPRDLTPANFAAQFIEPSDEAAAKRAEAAVRGICEGLISPDTDFRAQWIGMFGDNMMKDRHERRVTNPGPGRAQ